MNPLFNIGDEVVCRIGGPRMLINSVSAAIPVPGAGPGQSYQYGCVYWNQISNIFSSAMLREALLEDAPKI